MSKVNQLFCREITNIIAPYGDESTVIGFAVNQGDETLIKQLRGLESQMREKSSPDDVLDFYHKLDEVVIESLYHQPDYEAALLARYDESSYRNLRRMARDLAKEWDVDFKPGSFGDDFKVSARVMLKLAERGGMSPSLMNDTIHSYTGFLNQAQSDRIEADIVGSKPRARKSAVDPSL